MKCPKCGLKMGYQEFEDEDGWNYQWVCAGTESQDGCWNYVDLEKPLEN